MARKKTNIKIKHKKFNLYSKKKSKARQALTVVATIFIACILGVVGYGIGKPIMEYFTNGSYTSDDSSSDDNANSADSSEISDNSSGTESSNGSSGSGTSSGGESVPTISNDVGKMYILPENAAASSASLNSALAAAKSAGCTSAAVTLKDSEGIFYYKTDIEAIKDTDAVQGSLTAQQIFDIISKSGLTPAAKISTLKDKTNPSKVKGSYTIAGGGVSWLDASPANGGKLWLSPFKSNTLTFVENITEELAKAGFKHIICSNTMFPKLRTSDMNNYLRDLPLTDSDKRTEALWNVLDSAETAAAKHETEIWIEISGADLTVEDKRGTDAEICLRSEKLKDSRLIITYAPAGSVSDAYKNAKEFAAEMKTLTSGAAETAVLVKNSFSGSTLTDVKRAFTEEGLTVFTE